MTGTRRVVVLASFAESLVNFRSALLGALAGRGHEVVACAPPDAAVAAALRPMGVGYRAVALDRAGLDPWRDLGTVLDLARLFRRLRPDVLLAYTVKPVIYGSLAARVASVPAVFSLITGAGASAGNDDLRARLIGSLTRFLYRRSLPLNRAVFFQNPDDRDFFVRHGLLRGPEQAILIDGSGVDLERFRPAAFPAAPSFLMIARLLPKKGVHDYVEAARRVKAIHPEVRFRLVGWRDDQAGCIAERDLDAWVGEGLIDYLGRLEDVRPAIAQSSVYVLPSYYPEGQPRSVLEAMAMGRPVITTDAPGCRETVAPGRNGFLVPVRDPDALARAMRRYLDAPELIARQGAESRRIAEARYDVHRINRVMLDAMGLG